MDIIILNNPALLSTVVVPIAIAFISWLLGERINEEIHAALNAGALGYSLLVFVVLAYKYGLSSVIRDPEVWTVPTLGNFAFIMDAVAFPILISIAAVTAFTAVYSVPYMRHRIEEMREEGEKPPGWGSYFFRYTMFAAAMIGTLLSTNTIEFYLFLELTLIPSFLLIAFYGYGDRVRIAILYLLWTHVGAVLFLLGALALGFKAGFDFFNPFTGKMLLGLGDAALAGGLLKAALLLMVVGLLVKMAVFGVHIWLPYAHAEAPTPISALLSPNLIGIGGAMMIRIVYTLFPSSFADTAPYLIGWALLTMIYGGFMALVQSDFKRLLAYSSVSQMGYLLLGIATVTSYGMSGAILHYLVHAFGKAILFLTAGTLIATLHGLRAIPKMGGLASKMPFTAALGLIGFMHITGIPPTPGLWSEYLIVRGAVQYGMDHGAAAFVSIGLALLVGIGLSTAYAFLTMKRAFYGQLPEHLREAHEATPGLLVPMAILAAMGIVSFFLVYTMLDPMLAYLGSVYGI